MGVFEWFDCRLQSLFECCLDTTVRRNVCDDPIGVGRFFAANNGVQYRSMSQLLIGMFVDDF